MRNNIYQNDFAFLTDVGRVRSSNQDQANIIVNKNNDVLILVADGMGGANSGEYASKLANQSLTEAFKKASAFISAYTAKIWLKHALSKANALIYKTSLSSPRYKGMGTTTVAILIHQDHMILINAGDSRAYRIVNGKLEQLSVDQSYVEYLRRTGQISDEEAKHRNDKNILMNAIGIYPATSYDIKTYKYNNEGLLLCSDGLFNNLTDQSIAQILNEKVSAKDKVISLIKQANENGGTDNIAAAYFTRISR